ncbi:MAG: class I SAM-dependent methyltransferase [Thermoleophilaceae bacterium]|nr:class I SAM-dependent methyltransferase [Thermoleophilaceae bacterium]
MSRRFAKLCDVEDFRDEELLEVLRSILPERDPATHVERKVWEFGQLALFLSANGLMREDVSALAIGAGDERILFWLANRLGRVVATDIYGEGDFASREAASSMLVDPASHAPYPYREDRLEVLEMDARSLDFEDGSFDVVFSLSSFEHFGSPAEIARAASEAGRVLRPGGRALIVTECFVRRHWRNSAAFDFAVRVGTLGFKRRRATPRRREVVDQVFTPRELRKRIVEPSGFELMEPLDLSISAESFENVARYGAGGRLEPVSGSFYPHILVQSDRSLFTSVALPLRKPAA